MVIFGKLIGGIFGFLIAGPVGILIGAIIGQINGWQNSAQQVSQMRDSGGLDTGENTCHAMNCIAASKNRYEGKTFASKK